MTRPNPSAKVLPVPGRGSSTVQPGAVPVRRYRVARLRLDGRAAQEGARFEHLKRAFD